MPDISLESFCSYMEEIGFIDIESLSDYLESFNNYKKRPIQEAIFIALIKFFKDTYVRNEDNLQRLCKRIVDNYNRQIAVKKIDSIKRINLLMTNKETIHKSIFLANLKMRSKIETVMRKYIKGYSRDKIKRKKLENSYSIYSPSKDLSESQSYNSYSLKNIKMNNTQYLNNIRNFNNTANSSVLNQTSASNYKNNMSNTERNFNNQISSNENLTRIESDRQNVYERLNSNSNKKKNSVNNYKEIIPSSKLREMKELEECSFRPKINYYYPTQNNSKNLQTNNDSYEENTIESIHEKLYNDKNRMKEKKNINSLEKMIKESRQLTFQPQINPISKQILKNNRSRSLNNSISHCKTYNGVKYESVDEYANYGSKSKDRNKNNNFLKNMEKQKVLSTKLKMLNVLKRQKELSEIYTYAPNINKSTMNHKPKFSDIENLNKLISKHPNSDNNANKSYDFSYLNNNNQNNNIMRSGGYPTFTRVLDDSPNKENLGNSHSNLKISSEGNNKNFKYSKQNENISHIRSRSKSKQRNHSNISLAKLNKGNTRRNDSRNFVQDRSGQNSRFQNHTFSNLKKNFQTEENSINGDRNEPSEIPEDKRSTFANKGKSLIIEDYTINENNIVEKKHKLNFNYNLENEYLNSENNGNSNRSRNFNEFYEKLHSQAEKIKFKKMELSNEIYSEKNGLTFKPKINKSHNYNINSSFYEREINFVKNKKENLEKMFREQSINNFSTVVNSRTKSKEEIKKTTKSVVERLYKREIEKIKEKEDKRIEEDKKLELEKKQRKKSKDEIQIHNKNIVERLYNNQIEKIKEKYKVAKKPSREQLQKDLDEIDINDISRIKETNNKIYSNVHSKVFSNLETILKVDKKKNSERKKKSSLSPTPFHKSSKEKFESNSNLLKQLKKEHRIKFKNEDLSNSKSKSKMKRTLDLNDDNSKINEASPEKENFDSFHSRDSFMKTIDENMNLKSNKIIKPIRGDNPRKSNKNSDYLLEMHQQYKRSSSIRSDRNSILNSLNSKDKRESLENNTKKKNSLKDYNNLSPIKNEDNNSINELQQLSNKSSFRDGEFNNGNHKSRISERYDNLNASKDIIMNTANNSNPFKDTNATNSNSKIKSNIDVGFSHDIKSGGQTDNSDNSRGYDNKENKFKSKGLERILNSRK